MSRATDERHKQFTLRVNVKYKHFRYSMPYLQYKNNHNEVLINKKKHTVI